jgi:Flp pilus assembly protein TadG
MLGSKKLPTLSNARMLRRVHELTLRFLQDRSGSYVIMFAVALPALAGFAAFGTEEGLLLYDRQGMQHAADSGAVSAAAAYTAGGADHLATHVNSVAASYGFVNGTNGTTVTVHQPPSSGSYANNSAAIEVIISQPQARVFSSLWNTRPIPITARAVAIPHGQACVLALDPTASSSFSEQGSVSSTLVNCSVVDDSSSTTAMSIGGSARLTTSFVGVTGGISGASGVTTTAGIMTGYHPVADPYADVALPSFSGCDHHNFSSHSTVSLTPGVYCGGISLNAGAVATLSPGTYYLDGGNLSMEGSSTLNGTGVTLVFTSSSGSHYATASIAGGANINLTAPTTGTLAGIAIFGDRNMPVGTLYNFTGGGGQAIGGAVYLPKGALSWSGNSGLSQRCTQIVADTIQMVGDSGLAINCAGYGTRRIPTVTALVE